MEQMEIEMVDCKQERKGEVTILDVLGVDLCRDAILDRMHIRDIVRSERVCRRWQRAVLDYLSRCRNLTLSIYQRSRVYKHSHRTVMIRDDGTFPVRNVLKKLGPSIVSLYTNRSDPEFYEDISSYCPRLRQIELKHLQTRGPNNISEQKLGRAFQNIELEKIKLVKCHTIDGKFLKLMNSSSLKTLSLIESDFRLTHVVSNTSRLFNVTNLEIVTNDDQYVLFLLDSIPKVENLFVKGLTDFDITDQNEMIKKCSQFQYLKTIDVREFNVNDEFLESLASLCKNLEYLNIAGRINFPCGRGLAALVLRPSPGTLLHFTRIREESLEALLEFLTPMNNALEIRGRKKVTLEMLKEASKSMKQCNVLELRLENPVVRTALLYPELKIILNVSLVRNSVPDNNVHDDRANAPNNVEVWEERIDDAPDDGGALNNVDAPNNVHAPVEVPDNQDALDIINVPDNANAPNITDNLEEQNDWVDIEELMIMYQMMEANIGAPGNVNVPDDIDAPDSVNVPDNVNAPNNKND